MEKSKRVNAFDGLRFAAISLVVSSHAGFLAQGGLANNIFFAISGFFLISPFKRNGEERFVSVKGVITYYIERFFRIIPVFWTYLLYATIFFPGLLFSFEDKTTDTSFFQNMFFIKSKGHLWFLQQEVIFFIAAPLFFIGLYVLKYIFRKMKCNEAIVDLICAVVLYAVAFYLIKFKLIILSGFYGNGAPTVFRPGFFMLGMATGYLYRAYEEAELELDKHIWYRLISDVALFLWAMFCVVSSERILSRIDIKYKDYYIGWQKPELCLIATCIALFFIATGKNCLADKVLGNRFFTYIGGISYEIYLFHWPFLFMLKNDSHIKSFLLIFFLSICVAGVINKYIGKPMISISKKITKKIYEIGNKEK